MAVDHKCYGARTVAEVPDDGDCERAIVRKEFGSQSADVQECLCVQAVVNDHGDEGHVCLCARMVVEHRGEGDGEY